MEQDEKNSRIYEAGFLLVPTLPEADLPREVTALKELLEKAGAQIIAEEMPKTRTLAYPMRPRTGGKPGELFSSAYFGWVKFEVSAEKIKGIEAALNGVLSLLRFLVVKTVRESTLSVPRAPRAEFKRERASAPKGAPASPAVSETELDKSLEKLIAA